MKYIKYRTEIKKHRKKYITRNLKGKYKISADGINLGIVGNVSFTVER